MTELEFIRSTNNNTWGLGISEEGLVFGSTANHNPSVYMPIANRYYEQVRGWLALTTRHDCRYAYLFKPITDKRAAGRSPRRLHGRRRDTRCTRLGHVSADSGGIRRRLSADRQDIWSGRSCCDATEPTSVRPVPCNLVASDDEWSAPIMAEVGPDGNVWVLDWYNYIVQHNPTPQGFETGKGNAYESDLRDKKHGRIYRLRYDDARTDVRAPAASGRESRRVDGDAAPPDEAMATACTAFAGGAGKPRRGAGADRDGARRQHRRDRTERGGHPRVRRLRRLGAFDKHALPAAVEAVHAALAHAVGGRARSAIAALPHNETSRAALLECDVLRDVNAQVQLAAVLALSDMPPSRQGAEALLRF